MSDKQSNDELSEEFQKLGQNLKQAAQTAWESPEAQRLRSEIRAGFHSVEQNLREATGEVKRGETGQKIKAEAADFSERVRSGQVEAQLRGDLLAALRAINNHLGKESGPEQASQASEPK